MSAHARPVGARAADGAASQDAQAHESLKQNAAKRKKLVRLARRRAARSTGVTRRRRQSAALKKDEKIVAEKSNEAEQMKADAEKRTSKVAGIAPPPRRLSRQRAPTDRVDDGAARRRGENARGARRQRDQRSLGVSCGVTTDRLAAAAAALNKELATARAELESLLPSLAAKRDEQARAASGRGVAAR